MKHYTLRKMLAGLMACSVAMSLAVTASAAEVQNIVGSDVIDAGIDTLALDGEEKPMGNKNGTGVGLFKGEDKTPSQPIYLYTSIPAYIPLQMDSEGNVTVMPVKDAEEDASTELKLINYSNIDIQITRIAMDKGDSAWTIKDYETFTPSTVASESKNFALKINGVDIGADMTADTSVIGAFLLKQPDVLPNYNPDGQGSFNPDISPSKGSEHPLVLDIDAKADLQSYDSLVAVGSGNLGGSGNTGDKLGTIHWYFKVVQPEG